MSEYISLSNYNLSATIFEKFEDKKINRTIPIPQQKTTQNDAKLGYFLQRTGGNFVDFEKYRIVTNIKEFIEQNNVTKYFKYSWIDLLEASYIGFLNKTGSRIIFRLIEELKSRPKQNRYYVMDLTLKSDNNFYEHFYTSKTTIDLNKKVHLRFCEGIFDAINIDKHIIVDNSLTIAVLNKDYISKIEYAIKKFGINCSISCYLDDDHNDLRQFKKYNQILKLYKPYIGKDYGENRQIIVKEVTAL